MSNYADMLIRTKELVVRRKLGCLQGVAEAEKEIADYDAQITHEQSLTPEESEAAHKARCDERHKKFEVFLEEKRVEEARMSELEKRINQAIYAQYDEREGEDTTEFCPTCGQIIDKA